jgi:hypothetical protein
MIVRYNYRNWINTGSFSLIGGFLVGFAVAMVLSTTGDCAIGAVANGIFVGIPVGNVVGIGVYRKFVLNSLAKADIAGGILALILSGLAIVGGIYTMDVKGAIPGLVVGLLGSCLGSLLGYALGLRIVGWHEGQR